MAKGVTKAERVRLGPQVRVVLPAGLRRALGIRPGDGLVAWVEGDRLILRRREAIEEELWDLFRGVRDGKTDELIAERREEARRELEST
jgi:AbrB family looped-hinge helix DNA binding protein